MYEANVVSSFSGAHFLKGYDGQCENLHGHNWKVEALVEAKKLDKTGLSIDFKKLKAYLSSVLKELDHACLNELTYFNQINPSAENIAQFIYKKLAKMVNNQTCRLKKVLVWETETSCATYTEGKI